MRKLLILLALVPSICFGQLNIKKTFKFSTFYGAVNGGTSISDVDKYSISDIFGTETIETPFDYSLTLGIRKIARFGYENRSKAFYDGTETSRSDAANIGKIKGFEFLFELDYRRQLGINYLDQHHFLRYVADKYIIKTEYLQDGFADIKYFEASQRYRLKLGKKLSFNIGAAQRLSEPYGYDPLGDYILVNGNIHYNYLAIEEMGYDVDVFNQIYTNPSGDVVATNIEIWEEVVIPQILSEYVERERSKLSNKIEYSVVIGYDFYHYKKSFWFHSWGNLMPYHYNDGGEYSYHAYNNNKQWTDYSAGIIFGYKLNKQLGCFAEGRYNKYWNRQWHDFSFGINYVIF